jgi:hypothetical protein
LRRALAPLKRVFHIGMRAKRPRILNAEGHHDLPCFRGPGDIWRGFAKNRAAPALAINTNSAPDKSTGLPEAGIL